MARLPQALLIGFLVLSIVASFAVLALSDNDAQKSAIKIEHSIDGKAWKPRGQVSYRASAAFLTSEFTSGASTASIEQDKLSPRDLVNLEELAQNGGIYRVRIPVGHNSFVSASVPACQLLASGLSDDIDVHMSSSKVIGISYHVASTKCVKKSVASENAPFQTRVSVKHAEDAPRPNLDPHGSGTTQTAPAAPAPVQEEVDDRSFFAKYWHYMIPIPAMLLLLVGMVPDGKKEGQKKPAARS